MNFSTAIYNQRLKILTRITLLLPLLAFGSGCGGDKSTTEETFKISDITVSVTGNQASIQWKTEVPADSLVDYGVTKSYGTVATEATLKPEHALTLTGLQFQTTYHFRVKSRGEAGVEAQSGNVTFGTLAEGEKGPRPAEVKAVARVDSATITWQTNESVRGEVEYGEDTAFGLVAKSGGGIRIAYTVQLTGLKPETTYHYRVKVTDLDGVVFTSPNLTFKTGVKEVKPGESITRVNVTARRWEFEPATIQVPEGDKVILTIKSVDVAHGFGLFAFRIDKPLNPGQEVVVEFIAKKKGEYPFECTDRGCGDGHDDMTGTLIVERKP